MNNPGKRTLIRTTAIMVTMVYVFIMTGYLFFTPIFQNRKAADNAGVKLNTQLIYNLIRTNRCMVNDNKPAKSAMKVHSLAVVSKHHKSYNATALSVENTPALYFLIDHHFSYLSNRVLRI